MSEPIPPSPRNDDVVELGRRIQRIELLLFHTPDAGFAKLDQHINAVLSTDLEPPSAHNPGATLEAGSHPVTELPAINSCQFFDLSDDPLKADDSVSAPAGVSALDCSTRALLEAEVAATAEQLQSLAGVSQELRNKISSLHSHIEQVSAKVDSIEATESRFDAVEIVSAVNDNTNSKMDVFNCSLASMGTHLNELRCIVDGTLKRVDALEASLGLLITPVKPSKRR